MKSVIVTGCAGGLGTALCSAFRAAGYNVIGTDRVHRTADCHTFVELDWLAVCSDEQRFDEAVRPLRTAIASEGLAALINNAAVQLVAHAEDLTLEDWRTSVTVNVTVPLLLTQAFLNELEQGHGSVINIGSVHARATKPRFVAYSATKAALEGLTRSLAVDLGSRVRVLSVNPAAIDTPMLRAGFEHGPGALKPLAAMHPIGRIATPEEISRFVVFLASEGAGFATGAAINLDGGILSRLHDPE